jgi:microcystin-dependent protein
MGAEPFIGEIQMFGGNFAPRGWAFCEGQLLPISQNDALFALVGTTYGGDGQATFALPDLRGRMPIHEGQGPGLSPYVIGQFSGTEAVVLSSNAMPAHNHAPASGASSESASPGGGVWGPWSGRQYSDGPASGSPNSSAVQAAGNGLPHENMPPFLAIRFIIALEGVFPSRN